MPSQKLVYEGIYNGFNVWCRAGGTVERVRGAGGSVVPARLALAARAELDGVVVRDVTVPPQVEARALGVLLRRAILAHQRRQPVVAATLHQHQTLLDQILRTNKGV